MPGPCKFAINNTERVKVVLKSKYLTVTVRLLVLRLQNAPHSPCQLSVIQRNYVSNKLRPHQKCLNVGTRTVTERSLVIG